MGIQFVASRGKHDLVFALKTRASMVGYRQNALKINCEGFNYGIEPKNNVGAMAQMDPFSCLRAFTKLEGQ